mgnify:FL=1
MSDLITVVVPVYNVESYLERCVTSIRKQSHTNLEILLVNDGSTDKSLEICQRLEQEDQRIRLISQANGGLSAARNTGIAQAKGQYIAFIDSDDVISLDMMKTLYQEMVSAQADLAMCSHYDIYDDQIPSGPEVEVQTWVFTAKEAIGHVMAAKGFTVMAPTKLYKRSLFDDLKFELGKIAEDAFIMIRLLAKCQRVVATDAKLYYYMHRPNSITTQKFSLKYLNVIEAYQQNYEIIKRDYPDLLPVAMTRLYWAHFYVYDRLLLDSDYQDDSLKKRLRSYLTDHFWQIMRDPLFTKGRKLSMLALQISPALYKQIISKKYKKELHG